MKFWILWILDALVALGFVYFFMVGIGDGSVSSFNIVLWLGILGGLAAILGGALWLKHAKHIWPAIGLLLVLGIPAILSLLFFLVVLISNPRWN